LRRDVAEFKVAAGIDIPLTLGGKATFNIQNAMAATAAAYALGFSEDDVRVALQTFNPTPTQNPGRMNIFDVGQARILLDFGHNVPALEALDQIIPHLVPRPGGRILRVAYLAGNRLDEDLHQVGAALAKHCTRLWISDPDPRGREVGEASQHIAAGARDAGLAAEMVSTNSSEWDNFNAALAELKDGDLLIVQCVDHNGLVSKIRELQSQSQVLA
jgi:cyanophycin synthetase